MHTIRQRSVGGLPGQRTLSLPRDNGQSMVSQFPI